jgi:arsenite methyltransferase
MGASSNSPTLWTPGHCTRGALHAAALALHRAHPEDSVMPGMLYDNKAAAQLEEAYATSDMIAQREELRRTLRASPGETILDLGSGPGFLACELAQEVGATGRIVAVDISEDMNAISSKRIATVGLGAGVEILKGDATALAFADATFDAAASMQVIEYLADPDAALNQLARVLRPGGRLVIVDTDWGSLVWAATDRGRADRVAAAWNEHLPDPYLPRSLAPRLRAAGFEVGEIRIVPILNTAYDVTTFSYNIAPLIAAFVAGRGGVSGEEATEWLNDLAELQSQGRYFFSVNRYLFAASAPGASAGAQRLVSDRSDSLARASVRDPS